ncbi:MAG: type II secretion system protein [Bdellovibrionia bacterium]
MRSSHRKGFTLLETLLAMVILSSGILLLTNSWSGSFARLKKTQLTTEISALLERKMVEIEAEYAGKPLEAIPEEQSEDFGEDYPQYSWELQSKELEVPDLSASLTAREGGANEMLIMVIRQLSEHLSKSVKEVKVSIVYKGGKNPIRYSATTYFVNYDKPLSIGGAGAPAGGN